MNEIKSKSELGSKLGIWLLQHKALIIILSFSIIGCLGIGVKNIKMSSDYRYFFGKDNPQRIAFENFQKVYAKDDSALIVIESESGTIFNKDTLLAIKELTDLSWKVPFSTRVDSLSNYQHTEALDDDLIVRDLIGGRSTPELSDTYISKIRKISTLEPLLINNIVNKDGTVTAVNVRVTLPGNSPTEIPEVAKYVRKMVKEWQVKNPGHNVYYSGMVFMNNAFNEAAMNDLSTLIPLMYLIIFVIMTILLRTVFSVLTTFIIVLLSVIGAMGFTGWVGIPITPPSSIAPTVILTLAIADSIHLLKSFIRYMKNGLSKTEAIIEGLRINFTPVFLTSLTTAIGFLSLNFSDTPPFQDLGNITAMGVMLAFILSVTLLPVLTAILPLKVKVDKSKDGKKTYSFFADWVIKKRNPIIFTTLFLFVFLGLQIPKIKLNDQYVNYFDKSIDFRNDTDFITKRLTGIYHINFDIRSGESQGIAAPEFLKNVKHFVEYAETLDAVTHVNTITDVFKRLNQNMHGDQRRYYKLPESRELAAQYLLLYEMSLPYGLDLNNQIDIDKSSTRVIVTIDNVDTTEFLKANSLLEQWLVANTPKVMHAPGTSPAIMFAHITERNVRSMAWGTFFAFGLISLVLAISLKSFKYGVISLLPNVVPAFLAFGIWSLTIGEAGFAIAVVTSVTIGIVVDDTVHFLSKYVRARREKGLSAEAAIHDSFESVGTALIATTIILSIGFSILMLSPFLMNWTLGALSALTITLAFIIDFTFLPAVLVAIDGRSVHNTTNNPVKDKRMIFKKIMLTFIIIGSAIGLSKSINAQESHLIDKGLRIARMIDARYQGWNNQVAEVEMVLRNKQGGKSTRKMKIKTLEVKNDGDKSLTIFKSPRDVKGTAFLSHTHATASDEQWIFLPALKRVKRISSHNKSGPFMGSEFAYEDISSQEVEKYTYKFIKDTTVNGLPGHIFERYPVDTNSGYTKQVVSVDSKEYRIHRVEYYDRKGYKLKTLKFLNYKLYLKKHWRPGLMQMINLQNGKSTDLTWLSYTFKNNITERDFSKSALKRVR